jgi:uncharacterized protein
MSPEERQLLSALFARVQNASNTPRDPEAESLIADALRQLPQAPYYLAQAVIVQEKGLEAASKRIEALEASLRHLQQQLESVARPPEQKGGFLSSIFGASEPPPPPAPRAQQQQTYNPSVTSGPWGPSPSAYGQQAGNSQMPQPSGPWSSPMRTPSTGGSFLTGALGTAAGVAGGMLLANSLSGLFGSHMAGLGLGNPAAEGLAAAPVEETVINNFYGDDAMPGNATASDASDMDSRSANLQQADLNDDDGGSDWGDDGGDGGSYA